MFVHNDCVTKSEKKLLLRLWSSQITKPSTHTAEGRAQFFKTGDRKNNSPTPGRRRHAAHHVYSRVIIIKN
jgi:hypothetical protein